MDYYPLVQCKAIPSGTFLFTHGGGVILPMQTVYETRRQRIEMLIKEYGSIAALNEKLGWSRTDSRISRVKNANARTDRDGKVFQMGDGMAREIETTLALEEGWMDTPPSYAELHGQSDPIGKAVQVLEAMEPEARYQALRLLDALAQPAPANGTHGH